MAIMNPKAAKKMPDISPALKAQAAVSLAQARNSQLGAGKPAMPMGGGSMPAGNAGLGAAMGGKPMPAGNAGLGAAMGGKPMPAGNAGLGAAMGSGRPMNIPKMKNGGNVSSASKRADGIAQRGKTRGRMV